VEEYLLGLREASRDLYQQEWLDKIAVGDVVLISAPNKTRCHWQMGQVTQLLPGRDKIVRTVQVRRPDRTEGVYAISLLYPLELNVTADYVHSVDNKNSVPVHRPKRTAAVECIRKIKASN